MTDHQKMLGVLLLRHRDPEVRSQMLDTGRVEQLMVFEDHWNLLGDFWLMNKFVNQHSYTSTVPITRASVMPNAFHSQSSGSTQLKGNTQLFSGVWRDFTASSNNS